MYSYMTLMLRDTYLTWMFVLLHRHVSSKVVTVQVPFMMAAASLVTVQVCRKKNTGFVKTMPRAKV